MTYYLLLITLSLTTNTINAYPTTTLQEIKLPNVKNISTAAEINQLNFIANDVESEEEPLASSDIETTVKEVEDLLKRNANLPRLTRGEILDILDNITKSDAATLAKVKTRQGDQRAIMVVMPYSAGESGNVQELYTKPPITHIIQDQDDYGYVKEVTTKKPYSRRRQPNTKKSESATTQKAYTRRRLYKSTTAASTTTSAITSTTTSTTVKPFFSDTVAVSTYRPFSYLKRKTTTTTESPEFRPLATKVNIIRNPPSAFKEHPNHNYRNEEVQVQTYSDNGIRIIAPPSASQVTTEKLIDATTTTTTNRPMFYTTKSSMFSTTNRPVYSTTKSAKTSTTIKPSISTTTSKSPIKTDKPIQQRKKVAPQQLYSFDEFKPMQPDSFNIPSVPLLQHKKVPLINYDDSKPIPDSFNIPSDIKLVVKDLDRLIRNNPDQFPTNPTNNAQQFTPENVQDLLDSIAAYQKSPTTTTTALPDISNVADNLTPDMKDLLMSFGLIPDKNKKTIEIATKNSPLQPSADINTDSYSMFKPLPHSDQAANDEDMDDFLARFGLGRNAAIRSQKAISFSKPQNSISTANTDINFDAVPDQLRSVLTDIGLSKDSLKQADGKVTENKQHVFSPSDTQYASKEELDKLNQLLDVIKQLEKINGTASEDDLKGIDLDNLKQLVGSLNSDKFVPLNEQVGPNPASYSAELNKNEIKRQTSTTVTPPTVVTEESKNGPLADLEASFGGSVVSVVTEGTTTTVTEAPQQKTGFYYLVDWNSFLDIDNQKGKRVNLRFQPTIGDPKRFLSVSVP